VFLFELQSILSSLAFFVLHVISSNIFPKTLSKKEEKRLIELLKTGDKDAKNKLIEHNLRLVAHITKKYHNSKSDPDDLISIGTIGLIKAINTFDGSKNTKLSSYASRCIENEILMHFRNSKKAMLDLSLNEPIETDKNGNVLTLIDTISSDECIFETVNTKIDIEKLNKYLVKLLTPRERIIICLRYGLNGLKPLPQREVAKKLGISRSYVSRIEKKAVSSLKKGFFK
jgi:RNA polymerase sigma factor, sigma-70 family